MQLAGFVAPLNYRAVRSHLSVVLQLMAAVLLPSAVVGLISREFVSAGIIAGVAAGVYLIGRLGDAKPRPGLEVKEALVVTGLAYPLFALLGAIAFLPEVPFIDGLFEVMSGVTTTGLSTLNPETLPNSLLFFRASTQWIGGAGIIIVTLVVLSGPGRAAFRLYAAEFGGENLVGNVVNTARIVVRVYLVLTALCFLALMAAGMSPFDALLHALSTVSTGGFSPYSDSVAHFDSPAVEAVTALFMVLGAISFPLYYLARVEGIRRFFADLQLRYLLLVILLASVVFLAALSWGLDSILPSVFQAVSAATGTGFSSVDVSAWPEGSKLVASFLMLLGGSTGSTTGGIKLLRLIILLHLLGWLLVRALLPHEARVPVRYGPLVVSDSEMKEILGFLAGFMTVFFFSAMLLTYAGNAAADAVFESASALGTVGLSTGITSAGLAIWLKLLLIFEMWAGRLEMLPVVIVLYPGTWRRRRRPR